MRIHLTIALFSLAACATDDPGMELPTDPFGPDGASSSDATQLMAKRDAITNDLITGVYETSATASGVFEETDGSFGVVMNKTTKRIELRRTRLTAAMSCALTYDTGRPPLTLVPFKQLVAVTTDNSFAVTVGGSDMRSDPVSETTCTLTLPAEAWAFCEVNGSIVNMPDGATKCMARQDQELILYTRINSDAISGESMGMKVAN